MDINIICLFPDELRERLKDNVILKSKFGTLTTDMFKAICKALVPLIFCEESTLRLDEAFYKEHTYLEMSRVECTEFVKVFFEVFRDLGAGDHDMAQAIKRLVIICRFIRKFKAEKRNMVMSRLETLLRETNDLNIERSSLLEHVEEFKKYQDKSANIFPRILYINSFDSSSGEDNSGLMLLSSTEVGE